MDANKKPIEVIVDGGNGNLRRCRSTSSIGGLAPGDMSMITDGAMSEGEGEHAVKMAGTAFMNVLRIAIKDHGKVESLVKLAENHPLDSWRKALLWASCSGQEVLIDKFKYQNPPFWKNLLHTAKDGDGFTSLHRAVVMGQEEVVKKLLTCHGENAHLNFFEILHARTPEGWTALHLAVVGDEDMVEKMVKLLIYFYDRIELPAETDWDFSDKCWMTPLHYAVLGKSKAMVTALMEWDTYYRHINAHDYFMRTPFHMAASHSGAETLIDIFISARRVDLNAVDCCLYTPLHWAVYTGATDAVRSIISQATERTIRTTEEDVEGRPVLQIAIENKMVDPKVCRDIEKLLLTSADVKDEVERWYRDRQVYVDAANAILVGAALIASVTFGGWLQPPRGNDSPEAHKILRMFWALNSLSFFFSIATIMAGAGAVLPMEDVYIGKAVRNIRRALALTSSLLIICVVLILGAFGASGFASRTSFPNLTENMIVTTAIGTTICTFILLWFLKRLYRIRPDWMQIFPFPIFREYHQLAKKARRGLVEIQTELEVAERRAREKMQKTYGKTHGNPVDLTDMTLTLGRASEEESLIRRHSTNPSAGDESKKGYCFRKENIFEQRMVAFEEGYERSRMLRTESGSYVQSMSFNMSILNSLSPRGVHHWVDDIPTSYCRTHSLKKDTDRWAKIQGRVLLFKKPKLEEEITKFEYGMLGFEDWCA